MYKVVEIFKSIDGEGVRTGLPVVFIRLHGCNLRCKYCDTKYSYNGNEYTEMSLYEVLNKTLSFGIKRVTITGGEPLIHDGIKDLIRNLVLNNCEVNIETNGAVDLFKFQEFKYNTKVIFTMDYKCECSGMEDEMILSNLDLLREQDVLKFVVGSKSDLDKMKEIIDEFKLKCRVYVSPVFGMIEAHELVEYVLDNKLNNVTVQVQLHKIIWNPDMRGV